MRRRNLLAPSLLALAVLAGAGTLALPARAADAPLGLDADARSELAVTVYNRNLALVREVRRVEVPEGVFELEFRDVPQQIETRSLLVESRGRPLNILEQNYEFDLMSREKILAKYVGRDVTWIQEDWSRVKGRLLGIANGPVFEVDGEVVFDVPGRIALPDLPADLRARPTLVWKARSARAGATDLEVSYLTRGLSWSADYVLQLDAAGEKADLQSWVTLENRCGAAFADAQLLLVAGDIHQVTPPRAMLKAAGVRYMADMEVAEVAEEALYDYHLYTLPGTSTLKDNSAKQVSLFQAEGLDVQRHYRVQGTPGFYRGAGGGLKQEQDVSVYYSFENSEDNAMGRPLPAGVMRVYGASSSGQRQLLGEDRIRHTPRDEKVELLVGKAFDIKAERTRVDYQRRGENAHESAFRIELRNHKDEEVSIEVLEPAGGDWRVLESSHPAVKVDAGTLRFDLKVPARGETVLDYRLLVVY